MIKRFFYIFLMIFIIPLTALSENTVINGYVKVPDGLIFYRILGHGKPIILFTGTATTMNDWPPKLIRTLSHSHEIILFDYPGVNHSTLTNPNFTFKDLSNDVAVMMKKLNISSVDILGWSMGGWIAQEFAIHYPKKINHLILIATDPGGRQRIQATPAINSLFEEIGKAQTEKQQKNILKKIIRYMFPVQEYSKIGPEIQKLYNQGGKIAPSVVSQQILLAGNWSSAQGGVYQDLQKITAPTLIINGLADNIIPSKNGLLLVNNIKNSSIFRFPFAGHGVMYQYPNKMAMLIDFFIRDRHI